jgi:hypothetical protein
VQEGANFPVLNVMLALKLESALLGFISLWMKVMLKRIMGICAFISNRANVIVVLQTIFSY